MSQYVFQTEKIEDGRSGIAHIASNIEVCDSVSAFLSDTLGPFGQDKLFYGKKLLLTNDGATILENMRYKHPVARLLVDVSKSQDNTVGDGTTSVIILATEILKHLNPLIRDRYSLDEMKEVVAELRDSCVSYLQELKVALNENSLHRLAETSLNSKSIRHDKAYFASLLVRALKDDSSEMYIVKVPGSSVRDSVLVDGIAFEKTFTYAGYEQQPRRIENPKVCCLNMELEWKSERENGEVKVDSVEEYERMVEAEWKIIDEKLEDLVGLGVNVVLSSQAIGDYATQYFAARGIFSAGRVPNLDRVVAAFGGSISSSTKYVKVSQCSLFEERQLGGIRCNYFEGTRVRAYTLVLRGPGEDALDEVERAVHDAVCAIKTALRCKAVVPGGGSVEMELSKFCREESFKMLGKQLFIYQAVSKALEKIPSCLAKNFGHDPFSVIHQLRKAHIEGNRQAGIGCEGVGNMAEAGVIEPMEVKESMIKAAFNIVETILSIDSTIISKKQ